MTTYPEREYLFQVHGPSASDGAFLVGYPAAVAAMVATFYGTAYTAVPVSEVAS